ncbi:XRE family transcriptional regulator [Micromonospora matsumotoense]|uniref:XRE family transcriptional regulator n=1 Tax=Micromonospora matsumotoense TaxID=121616 RepID=UPI0034152F87
MDVREFVAALGALRLWSGLSYRELAAKAQASGGSLPPSTITSMLGRNTLPRAPLITTFVLACGLDQDTADRWTAVRNSIAMGPGHLSPTSPEPPGGSVPQGSPEPVAGGNAAQEPAGPVAGGNAAQEPADPQPKRRRFRLMVIGLAAAALVISVAALLLPDRLGSPQEPAVTEPPLPSQGWFLIQPAHVSDHRFCVGEGRERNHRTDRPLAVQRPCAAIVPDTYLAATGIGGVYEIQWHHPKEGVGCLTVDEALTADETLVAPDKCTGAPHQRYQLEPARTPTAQGYRIRPTHSGLCLGVLGGPADVDNGAEIAQSACTGAADQVFLLQPTTRSF